MKKVLKFSKKIIIIAIANITIYTLAIIILSCYNIAIPDTLNTCFFAFWSAEAGVLGLIKSVETFAEWYEKSKSKAKINKKR